MPHGERKRQVIALLESHPDWCDVEVAQEARCHTAYVRSVAAAVGHELTSRINRGKHLRGASDRNYNKEDTMAAEQAPIRIVRTRDSRVRLQWRDDNWNWHDVPLVNDLGEELSGVTVHFSPVIQTPLDKT